MEVGSHHVADQHVGPKLLTPRRVPTPPLAAQPGSVKTVSHDLKIEIGEEEICES
jgi:hypothetical protein